MACPGFILAGAEKNIRWSRNFSVPPRKNSASPAEFDSAPRAEQERGGRGRKREKHLIIENRGREPN